MGTRLADAGRGDLERGKNIMKVRFYCDSGANIHSCRDEIFDTVEDLGLEDGEWEKMDDEAKEECVKDWMSDHLDYGWEENPTPKKYR